MTLSPHRNTTFADLLRLAAGWLVLVLLVQSLQWAGTLGAGPRHRHGPPAVGAPADVHAHHHHHDAFERHHHAPAAERVAFETDRELDDALERAAFALAAALALLAFAAGRAAAGTRTHVLRGCGAPAWRSAGLRRWRRPPRPA